MWFKSVLSSRYVYSTSCRSLSLIQISLDELLGYIHNYFFKYFNQLLLLPNIYFREIYVNNPVLLLRYRDLQISQEPTLKNNPQVNESSTITRKSGHACM